MLTTRDLIRIRYIIWKVRAWCWLVERLRARGGRMARAEGEGRIQKKPLTGAKCIMRPDQGQT
jgi:hypothetical protein